MSTLLADPIWSAALGLALKASTVLALAALADVLLRRRGSAAARHLAWTLALAALVMLPIASVVAPEWRIAVTTMSPAASAAAASAEIDSIAVAGQSENPSSVGTAFSQGAEPGDTASASTHRIAWSALAASVYLVGLAAVLALLVIQRWSLRRFARTAEALRDPEWTGLLADCAGLMGVSRPVRLLWSARRNVPMTFGTGSPAIVVPAEGDLWSAERRRAVLLHELAHVARLDCLTQTLAMFACAMYWFHPAAWWAARRLRVERELACDDRVIAAGTEPREYAGHLLDIAYALGASRAPALAVTMARRGQLESRLLAALDAARNRRVPPFRLRVGVSALALVVLAGLATVRVTTVSASAGEEPPASPVTSLPEPAAAQPRQLGPTLKRVDWPVSPLVRRLRDIAAVFGIPQRPQSGTWEIRPTDDHTRVHLRIVEQRSSWGSDVPLDRLEGLTRAQLEGAGGPVQFRIRRDAGTLTFDGVLRNSVGAGTFSFSPDPNFPAELAKRGFARPTPDEQYDLARADVGYAFLDELDAQGYQKPDTAELVRAGQHGVGTDYLREMGAIG